MVPLLLSLVFAAPPTIDLTNHDGTPSLVISGDSGEPGRVLSQWRAGIKRRTKDAVLVLGDIVYEQVPPCPNGVPDVSSRKIFEKNLSGALEGLGAPVFIALGNHDRAWIEGEAAREKCVVAYVKDRPELHLPERYYAIDLGVAVIVVLDTNVLDEAQMLFVKEVFAAHPNKRHLLAGHHVYKTYHDKAGEDLIRPWLAKYDIKPDLFLNAHAHILQFGIYDGVPAVTSGTASRPRERASCAPLDRANCGDGELFGSSVPGYAVLDFAKDGRMTVTFENAAGEPLYSWMEGL